MPKKPETRTKLLSLVSGTLIAYVLPSHLQLSELEFVEANGMLVMKDGKGFSMNLSDTIRSAQM